MGMLRVLVPWAELHCAQDTADEAGTRVLPCSICHQRTSFNESRCVCVLKGNANAILCKENKQLQVLQCMKRLKKNRDSQTQTLFTSFHSCGCQGNPIARLLAPFSDFPLRK